jgi:hypothetical protein
MTQQDNSRNNLTISMFGDTSVPNSVPNRDQPNQNGPFRHVQAPRPRPSTEPPPVPKAAGRGACSHGYLASGSFCMPSSGAADAIANPGNGTVRSSN